MKRAITVLFAVLLLTVHTAVFANETAGISAEAIADYPAPNVRALLPNEEMLYDRVYRQFNGAVEIFNAPAGSSVGIMADGFNFATVHAIEGDWAMINDSQWVNIASMLEALPSRYAGVRLPSEPLPYPFGWVLVHTRASQQPGAEPLDTDPLYYRYALVNLYSYVEVDGWRWYQVGVDQWIIQTQIAKFLPVERPTDVDTERWVSVDLYEQTVVAYEGETPVFASLISSGLSEWPTNEGLFHVYVRYPRTLMSGAEGQPDFYYLEEVPWTMYFDGDIGLHGAYWHDGFGYRRSHGCVNMSITDAAWLYEWASPEFDFSVDNDLGPAVYVYSSGVYR
jgi:hypothetical protein